KKLLIIFADTVVLCVATEPQVNITLAQRVTVENAITKEAISAVSANLHDSVRLGCLGVWRRLAAKNVGERANNIGPAVCRGLHKQFNCIGTQHVIVIEKKNVVAACLL